MPWSLYPQHKRTQYPLAGRQDGLQGQSGQGSEEKKSHYFPCWDSNPSHSAHSLFTILSYLCSPALPKTQWDKASSPNFFSRTFSQLSPACWFRVSTVLAVRQDGAGHHLLHFQET